MAITQTTTAAFKNAGDKTIKLTSATGILNKMLILCEGEFMRVTDISNSPTLGVVPGYLGTVAAAHLNGAPAYFGLTSDFNQQSPLGPSFNALLKSSVNVATTSAGFATDTYLVGSEVSVPPAGFVNGMRYVCKFDMVKTSAGTATPVVTLRIGTAGTTADTSICAFTFAAGTAAADTGTFTVTAHFKLNGTAAVVIGLCECPHALAATGLHSTGASGYGQIQTTSSAFDSTPSNTIIGVSFNGGASFSGTNSIVEAELKGF